MRVFFYRKLRTVKAERTKRSFKLWEDTDGYHDFANDAILRCAHQKYDTKIMFYEGRIAPLGSKESLKDINSMVSELELIKINNGVINISKSSSRIFEMIRDNIGIILVIGLFAMAAYFGLTGGSSSAVTP
jgi:hypothetical protein